MAKCDLEIAIDSPDRTYRVGQTVTGFVGVEVNADCLCNGLTVTCGWETHGSGNRARGTEDVAVVFEGEWKAGEKHLHPFEFQIPRGPVTYRGHHLNVDWFLRARADIPWAIDPKAEAQVIVSPDDSLADYDLGPRFALGADAALAENLSRIIATVGAVIFGGFGLAFMGGFGLFFLPEIVGDMGAAGLLFGVPFLLFPLVFVGIAGWMLFRTWRNSLAERRLGPVELAVSGERFRPGDVVPFTLKFAPRADLEVTTIRAGLVASEVVIRGSGTKKKTFRHEVHSEHTELAGQRRLGRDEAVELTGELTLPADAPASFTASDNRLTWAVSVHIDIPGWPDWMKDQPIAVQPSVRP